MSLLKWKKLAKQKKELGNKINFVHDTILKNQLGEKISQGSFQKVFKPITTKLDDVLLKKIHGEKLDVPDYALKDEDKNEDEDSDYGLDDLFDEGLVPENKKQIESNLPTYEETKLKNIIKDYPVHSDNPNDPPPGYEEDEEIDYALDEEDSANMILDDLGLVNYDNIENQLNKPEMPKSQITNYLGKGCKMPKK